MQHPRSFPSPVHDFPPSANRHTAPDARASLLVLACICVVAGFFFFSQIGRGHLAHRDEFRTAERTREMLLFPDKLTVHENFVPYFHKPPLYYWLSAPLLAWLPDAREFAVRFWSAAFALGTLAATWWLARAVTPEHPWAAAAAAGFVCVNHLFLVLGRLAMLDTAQAFFVMATLAAALTARRDPRWWLGAAAFAGAAFLIKTPVAAALFFCAAAMCALDGESRRSLCSRRFAGSAALLLLLLAWWPAVETARFGSEFPRVFFGSQMARRFGENHGTSHPRPLFPQYARWLLRSWQWAAWPLLAAAAAGCAARDYRKNRGVLLLGLFTVSYGAGLLFVRPAFERYLLLLVPALAVLASVAIWTLTEKSRLRLPAVCGLALLCAAAAAQPETRRFWMDDGFGPRIEEQIPVAQAVGGALRPGEHLVLLRERGVAAEARLYLFYGNLAATVYCGRQPPWEQTLHRVREGGIPVQGVLGAEFLPRLMDLLPGAHVVSQRGDLIHWAYAPASTRPAPDHMDSTLDE